MNRFAQVIIGCISLMMPVALAAQSGTALSDLQVLAIIKLNRSESITLKQLKTRVETYQKQSNTVLSVADRQLILDAMIQEKLIAQAAQKAGMAVTDSEVDTYFLQMMAQITGANVTEQELNTLVREQLNMSLDEYIRQQTAMSMAEYKAYLKTQLLAQRYVVSQRQDELQGVMATDEQIRAFYELNKASFVQNDIVQMFLVVVQKGTDATAARARAMELLNSYKDKRQTTEQIAVRSRVTDSGFQAGDIWVNKTERNANQLGITYQELLQLFGRSVGFTSDLKENKDTYQFYTILQKHDAKMLSLSDVVQPGTTITVYDYIRQNLSQQQQMEYLQSAVDEMTKALDTSDNVERKKTGNELLTVLNW
ncbi:MAG: SurA N-terminal domain-containing protein [Treponema sp.]|nr:SurA N-terminal domain-containing protein [Treponema sp.]